ncbi:MAG: hypothetical protein IKM06_07485, partial [Clostridia bacterium]|nr:hypothetical protein [Clostridia bacterium]
MDFKFNYGSKEYTFKDFKDNKLNVENLLVSLEIKEYNEFSAKEWLLYFENIGEKDTDVISDI